jgi:hypothetical protein
MTEENLNLEEEDPSKLPDESESEETSDLDEVLEEDSNDRVKELEKEVADLKKGMSKFFSEQGRKTEGVKLKEVITPSVIKSLYFDSKPEAKEIWEEVETTAKQLGKDPFELYESSPYFKGEAKARFEAKAEEEKSKAKITKPSTEVEFEKSIESIKAEDVASLKPGQKMAWIKAQAEKERSGG